MIESRAAFSRQENIVRDPVIEHRTEVVRGLNSFVEGELWRFSSPERVWQPSDFYPDESQLEDRKRQAASLSKDVLVVIAAAYITENALPTYQTWLNRIEAVRDETGIDTNPWAKGTRMWTADESRHPRVIYNYMNGSGRFNMKNVEIASQHLIRNGFDPNTGKDPYKSICYVSIQEPATQVSHINTAIKAGEQGDPDASKFLKQVGGDEAKHTSFYQPIFREIVKLDPNGGVIALRDVIKQRVDMPGYLMTHDGVVPASGRPAPLYEQISDASKRSEIYTPVDYRTIVSKLIEYCDIEHLSLNGDEANKAQEDVARLNKLYKRAAERFTPKQIVSDTNLAYSLLK